MNLKMAIAVVSLAVGTIATVLSSLYNSSSYLMGLGNTGSWYGLPLGYSLYYSNELMGSKQFHYLSYENASLDFLFWTLIAFSIILGYHLGVRTWQKVRTTTERSLVQA